MNGKIKYQFSAKLWRHNTAGWYFLTMPKDYSTEIREHLLELDEGWGRMKAMAIIKDLTWDTSIWFDSKSKHYVLPVKAEVRKKLALQIDDLLEVVVLI